MAQKKIENYGLYQTFSSNIPPSDLSQDEIGKIDKKIGTFSHEQKCAFLMLIFEHARLQDQFEFKKDEVNLPYTIEQKENDISVDFSKLPRDLQWILFKFSNMINTPTSNDTSE